MMTAQILPFPGSGAAAVSPIACFVRIGEAHRKLADLHAEGELPARRAVIDASRYRYQKELVSALREAGAEIVLDTEAAELAAESKISSHSRKAPWAPASGVLGPSHFDPRSAGNVIGEIARFAVAHKFNVVLAPTHFLGDPTFPDWLDVDRISCLALREALDREGGEHIAIDYPLILPHVLMNDAARRGALLSVVADLPVDNVWLRASGLGPDAGPLTLKRYLSAVMAFHNLGKPLIADHLGGLPGEVALAFGAVSGLAIGVAERERFDASGWHKPPPPRDPDSPFGRAVRVNIPGLHRSATLNELEVLMTAKGARRLLSCNDRGCCPHGYPDLVADPRKHAAHQMFKSLRQLEAVPDLRRETYLLEGPLTETDRIARQFRLLNPSPIEAEKRNIDLNKLMSRYHHHSRRIGQLMTMLEGLHQTRGDEGIRCRPISREAAAEQIKKEDRR